MTDPAMVELRPGELYTTCEPTLIATILGSCVAVCLFSPALRTGAMCHATLPWPGKGAVSDPRYVECAVAAMLGEMNRFGALRGFIIAKLFGGAEMFPDGPDRPSGVTQVGRANILAARRSLSEAGVKLLTERVGGSTGYKVIFNTWTGEALVKTLGAKTPAR